jgi:hypothetical protein
MRFLLPDVLWLLLLAPVLVTAYVSRCGGARRRPSAMRASRLYVTRSAPASAFAAMCRPRWCCWD